MPQKSFRDAGIRCWSASEFWSGLGMGPMMRALGGGGIGATPCRGKPLGGTGSALDHGGVAAKHLARVACQDANSEPKRPRDAHDAVGLSN